MNKTETKELVEMGVPEEYVSAPKGIPIETMLVLRKKGLTKRQIAKLLGCSYQNVKKRMKAVEKEVMATGHYRQVRADLLSMYQRRILKSVDEKAIKEASLKDRTVAFGILYDKERLEMDKSTANIAYADLIKAKAQKQKELEDLRAQAANEGIDLDDEFEQLIAELEEENGGSEEEKDG